MRLAYSYTYLLAVGHQRHPPGFQAVATGVGIRHSEMVRIQVHADAPRRLSLTNGTSIISVLTNTRQPLPSRLKR